MGLLGPRSPDHRRRSLWKTPRRFVASGDRCGNPPGDSSHLVAAVDNGFVSGLDTGIGPRCPVGSRSRGVFVRQVVVGAACSYGKVVGGAVSWDAPPASRPHACWAEARPTAAGRRAALPIGLRRLKLFAGGIPAGRLEVRAGDGDRVDAPGRGRDLPRTGTFSGPRPTTKGSKFRAWTLG
jgi:hypothetical protein